MRRPIYLPTLILAFAGVLLFARCKGEEPDPDPDPDEVDPCGVIYEPISPIVEADPVPAQRTAEGIGYAPQPTGIRTGLYDDAATSFAVLWETGVDTTATVVQWGLEDPEENTRTGYTFLLGSESDPVRVHETRICGLEPGTTYQYRVGAEDAFSNVYSFTTDDPAAQSLSFVALGDSRDSEQTMEALMDMGMDHDPQFLLHTGDFLYLAHDTDEWREFWAVTTPELSEIPLIPVHGNHELFLEQYFGMVAAPGNEEWYSYDIGPLHLAVLNDSRDSDGLAEQAAWLDEDLAQSTAPFKIVATHRAFYSSGNHGSTATLQEHIMPVIEAHDIPLVLTGHDHGYERTHPMRGGEVQSSTAEGTTYVVTGGAGASLYGFAGDLFTAYTESVNHYCHIDISDDQLTFTAYRLDGTLLDQVVLD